MRIEECFGDIVALQFTKFGRGFHELESLSGLTGIRNLHRLGCFFRIAIIVTNPATGKK
jgi:hypothetical protein